MNSKTATMKRESGYYWVQLSPEYREIGLYDAETGWWTFVGTDGIYKDHDFTHIEPERIKQKSELCQK